MKMDWGFWIFLIIVVAYLLSAIRITQENERFAVYSLGRFAGFKGPGLVLKIPGGSSEFVRIPLGAEGEVQSNEVVLVGSHAMPFTSESSVRAGTKVRVTGFSNAAVKVEAQQKFVVCEKCGHKNAL